MLALATGVMFAAGYSVPCKAVTFAGFADPRASRFLSGEMARGAVSVARSCAEARRVKFGTVSTKDAASHLGVFG